MSWIKISGFISPDTARDVLMSRQKYVFCVASMSLHLIRNTSYCHCKQSRGLPNVSFKTRSYVTTNIAGDIQCPCLLSQTWVELS